MIMRRFVRWKERIKSIRGPLLEREKLKKVPHASVLIGQQIPTPSPCMYTTRIYPQRFRKEKTKKGSYSVVTFHVSVRNSISPAGTNQTENEQQTI